MTRYKIETVVAGLVAMNETDSTSYEDREGAALKQTVRLRVGEKNKTNFTETNLRLRGRATSAKESV